MSLARRLARVVGWPLMWSADRVRRTDKMLVAHDRRHVRFVVALDLLLFIGGVWAWFNYRTMAAGPLLVFAATVVGCQLGRTGIMTLRRATAYRSGWLQGRSAMVVALAEAQRRGMSPMEWLEGELQRDWAVLGIDPHDLEGHDDPGA